MLLCPHRFQWGSPCQYFQYVCPISSSTKNFSLIQWPQEEREQLCQIDISIFIIPEEANILWWLIKRLSMSSVVTMGKQTYCGGLYVFGGDNRKVNILWWLIKRLSMCSVVTKGKQETYCGGL